MQRKVTAPALCNSNVFVAFFLIAAAVMFALAMLASLSKAQNGGPRLRRFQHLATRPYSTNYR
jgi:hypothetical protein